MSKLSDYDFKGLPQDIHDFKDDVRDLLNNGKVQFSVSTTNPPNWAAGAGELALILAGGSAGLYVAYSANTWLRIAAATT